MHALPASFVKSVVSAFFFVLAIILVITVWGVPAAAQENSQAVVTAPRPLITEALDESRVTVLKGNTHPLARREFDLGTAPATLPMERMLLVLKRSDEQETALRKLLDDQQDKHSPNYHKWLTPEQFGAQFGPTDADLQTIMSWLQSHGFRVGTTKGRTLLEFSGSASQVQEVFHTSIHKYIVNGEQHWANASDPSIPAALAPAVAGPMTLHNFVKKPLLHMSKEPVAANTIQRNGRPEVTFGDGTHALGPYDFAKIYNSPALSGYPTGSGVTIGIVGRSNLYNSGSDVGDFRGQLLGSSNIVGTTHIIVNGPDPGDLGGGEEAEATLDTTWSGAVAPWATVDLVVSGSTNSTDGIDLSELYIIENNLADIMTESFGSCESGQAGAEAGLSGLAEQAAAQGISYFVSTGDSGAEGCANPNSETVATGPVSVNILASTQFNVAVGGTIFNEGSTPSNYWNSTNDSNNQSVKSYIPEDAWNESCTSINCPAGASPNILAGGGGASTLVSQPSWQFGVTGLPNPSSVCTGVTPCRLLPDVSLTAAGHDPYLLCLEASCVPNSQGQFFIYFVWGTSASAPAFAGIQALIDQKMVGGGPTTLTRQGLPNYELYSIAANENSSISQCNASGATLPASTCVFNDVTIGNNAVPGEANYGSATAQYQAGTGYDLATGLGSVNITNLINAWPSASFPATTTSFTINGVASGTTTPVNVGPHGTAATVGFTVTANSGTPSGDVSLIAWVPISPGSIDVVPQTVPPSPGFGGGVFSVTNGTGSGTTNQLPGGTYYVFVHYAGDGTFAPSDSSTNLQVTVAPEASMTTLSQWDQNGSPIPNGTSLPFGSLVFVRADVAGASGLGIPTGLVTFSDTFGAIPSMNPQSNPPISVPNPSPLNSRGNTSIGDGIISFDAGNHSISATYGGDSSFSSTPSGTMSNSVTFAVQPGFAGVYGPTDVVISSPGLPGTSKVGIIASTGFNTAINFTCTGLPLEATCSTASAMGQGPTTVVNTSITVNTTGPHTVELQSKERRYYYAVLLGVGLPFGIFFVAAPRRRRWSGMGMLMLLVALALVPACGGGSSHHHDPGTPAGTYTVRVTATAGSLSQQGTFTLVVK